jgi:hypothetical protein
MLTADLIHSCSNDKVAQAALACIGGCFAERVRVAAQQKGVSVGRFVVFAVRDFARRADEAAHEALRAKIVGDDQPLLKGLREVLESALESDPAFVEEETVGSHFIVGASCASSLRYH